MKFEDLEQVYRKWLYLDYEPNLLRLVVATYLSVQYKGIPLWMILIGSPGVGKSEMLMGLATCSKTVMMSKMSANALATAHRDAVPLLEQLKDNKIMVIKDMSTMTELPSEVRSAVFSDLRDSYDGRFVRYTGMGEYKWEGKFNIICGATPALERSRVHEASLGERFVQVRININADHERILQHRSFENALKITSMRKELAKATKEYLDKAIVGIHAPISVGTASRLHELAYMVAKARSDVPRNAYNREIESPSVSSEVPTRIASQIFILASALIEIGTKEDLVQSLVERVCMDTIPLDRVKAIEALAMGMSTVKDIKQHMRMSANSVRRCLEDLWYLGLAERDGDHHKLLNTHLGELTKKNSTAIVVRPRDLTLS